MYHLQKCRRPNEKKLTQMDNISIRLIEKRDNAAIAGIIRTSLKEFNANKPGTVYFEESTDHLFELFQNGNGIYYVATANGQVVGGAGIYPTAGLDADTCELVKIYLSPAARGKGLGKLLLQQCLEVAKETGYKKVYLETMPELIVAIPLYKKFGFTFLNGPLGNSGHTGCDIWMLREL
jgi:putative acetyltransferase